MVFEDGFVGEAFFASFGWTEVGFDTLMDGFDVCSEVAREGEIGNAVFVRTHVDAAFVDRGVSLGDVGSELAAAFGSESAVGTARGVEGGYVEAELGMGGEAGFA